MRKVIINFLLITFLCGCSTAGGIYKKDDPENGEFSVVRSTLGLAAVVGVIVAIGKSGGGFQSQFAWDYQPGNNQWVCRNRYNGQYVELYNCNGQPFADNWP